MKALRWVLAAMSLGMVGCTGWQAAECYKIPKYEWARCPYPEPYKEVRLPRIGYDGTCFEPPCP
jgi:hypothetical protein